MEYSPPPLFKQGAPARVKVAVFAFLSLSLLFIDNRYHALDRVRQVAGTVLYPFQMIALVPRDAVGNMGSYFSSVSALQKEVRALKSQQVATATLMQQAQLQTAENVHLRKLMDAKAHLPVQSMMSEILYDARDSSTRKIVLDRGTQSNVTLGLPVIDNLGVVGQVTRVFPFTSEVTLLTDKEQAIPVQVLRSGLRTVAYGRGLSGTLDLRFVAPNADVKIGDVVDHVRHGWRLSGRPGGRQGGAGGKRRRRCVRACDLPAAGRRRPQPPTADRDDPCTAATASDGK